MQGALFLLGSSVAVAWKGAVVTRRKKPQAAVKNHIITVRLNDIEYEVLCRDAMSAGMSFSEYLRHHIINGKVEIHHHIVADFEKLDQVSRDLSGIANNLNQLTKYFHMGGMRSKAMQDTLTSCLNEVMAMRKEIMELEGEYRGYTKASGK